MKGKTELGNVMTLISFSQLRKGLIFLCGVVVLIGSVAISTERTLARLQGQQLKSVSTGIVLRNMESDPVKIKDIKVGSAARVFEEQFDESEDWLKKLSLEIKNDWSKPIVFLAVALDFPETRSSGNLMSFAVYSGNHPGLPAKRENIHVEPGDRLVLNMAERYDWITQFLRARHSMSQIHKVEIKITLAVFDDKTAWGEGVFFVQDPHNPSRYTPVDSKSPTQ